MTRNEGGEKSSPSFLLPILRSGIKEKPPADTMKGELFESGDALKK